jgi:hypothetical protein
MGDDTLSRGPCKGAPLRVEGFGKLNVSKELEGKRAIEAEGKIPVVTRLEHWRKKRMLV